MIYLIVVKFEVQDALFFNGCNHLILMRSKVIDYTIGLHNRLSCEWFYFYSGLNPPSD